MHKLFLSSIIISAVVFIIACQRDQKETNKPDEFNPTYVNLAIPEGFARPMPILSDNPTTEEGVELGRHLFYDKRLSRDNTISCACCHKQEAAFADPGRQFSLGVDGQLSLFNSMAIINMIWQTHFFWDGRSHSLEHQAFFPVVDPLEMDNTWPNVVQKLESVDIYPPMFKAAFGDEAITQDRMTKALAQFQRTLISGNSKYDKAKVQSPPTVSFTPLEEHGFFLFELSEKGDCFHCHGASFTGQTFAAFGNFQFANNGLDGPGNMSPGRYSVTGDPLDFGKFKIPTLRNVALTGPYMHDGRFSTLREVIEHYNMGGINSATVDPNMKHVGTGLNLSEYDKQALEAFLETLTDPDFVTNPAFGDPFENDPNFIPCP
jgi:cytochrome c peroxidase